MHEKTKDFIVKLWEAGIPGGWTCLECFRVEEDVDGFGYGRTKKVTINKGQRAALVIALVEAGLSFDEIRAMEFARSGKWNEPRITDEELIRGEWNVGCCPMVRKIVEAVEKLHAADNAE